MPVTHLDELVYMMVKPSSNGLTEATKAVDGPNWRESLHRLVVRCYRQPKVKRSRRNSSTSRSRSGDSDCPCLDQISITNAIQLANNVREYSPVVSLYDVLKYQTSCDTFEQPQPLQQEDFLQYFGLNVNPAKNNDQIKIQTEKQTDTWRSSHPRHLLNSPQVPFSSDLGIKLIKERPEISSDVHERKIERLERYLHEIPESENIEYEVTYNKNVDLESSHFYTFPTKYFHKKDKLTPKALYLLETYCKECFVKVERTDMKNYKRSVSREQPQANIQSHQKENIHLLQNNGIFLETRVLLSDNFQKFKPNPSLQTSLIQNTNKAMSLSEQQNLKTLAPRNQNENMKIPLKDNQKNMVNTSVVLQPINNLIELRRSSSFASCSVPDRAPIKRANKIVKKQIKPYYSRRVSPRLRIVNKPLIM